MRKRHVFGDVFGDATICSWELPGQFHIQLFDLLFQKALWLSDHRQDAEQLGRGTGRNSCMGSWTPGSTEKNQERQPLSSHATDSLGLKSGSCDSLSALAGWGKGVTDPRGTELDLFSCDSDVTAWNSRQELHALRVSSVLRLSFTSLSTLPFSSQCILTHHVQNGLLMSWVYSFSYLTLTAVPLCTRAPVPGVGEE